MAVQDNGAAVLSTLLRALMSGQNQERQEAEKMFQQAKTQNPAQLLQGLMALLGDGAGDEAVRRQSAVLLRQLVAPGGEKDFAFAKLAHQQRQEFANELLVRFESLADAKLQQKVGEVIVRLADAVCDKNDQRGWLAPGSPGWPALMPTVFRLADASSTANPVLCKASIRLLKDLVETFKDQIVQAQQQLGAIVQGAMAHGELKVRCEAFVLVCRLVGVLEKKAWAPLVATAGVLTQVLQQLCQANMEDEAQECLETYAEVAHVEPDFFKQQLLAGMEPAMLLAKLVKTRDGVPESIRKLALEWLVTYVEKKPKWLAKSVPNFAPLAVECCMDTMLEVEDSEAELKVWIERMDDEEGEEDMDELHQNGAQAIDRVVEAMGMEAVSGALFTLIGRFAAQDAWQAKLAALTSVKQTVEYAEDTQHVNDMAKLVLAHVDHAHPRVRYLALQSLGQLANDQCPQFQDEWHATVMPLLLKKMEDPVDRVASMAMSAFVSFGEELDKALMMQYARDFMLKLVSRLQSSSHRMVQEESITSIAVIAGVIEQDFAQYYDGIMPLLKQLVLNAKGEKENRLRGKAFECMSLLGAAVGKERFLPDAKEAVAEMLKTPDGADDLQREYIAEASQRICKCLKADFAPFLPHLLPGLFKKLKLDVQDASEGKPGAAGGDDEDYITLSVGEGKLVKVRTSSFEEMVQAVQLLNTFCVEMEAAYFDYIQPTAQNLLPLLASSSDDSNELPVCDEARSAALLTWASLIKCARTSEQARGMGGEMSSELLRTFLQRACAAMQGDDDPDTLRESADGLAECLKNVGPGALGAQEVLQLVGQLFQFINASMQRSLKAEQERKADVASAPAELQQDEDEEGGEEDEETCRRSLEDAIGAVMQAAPAEFAQCLPECSRLMAQWLATKEHKALALFLACDLLQHLKEGSEQIWPVFMPAAFQALLDKDADVRIPAAYAISLAAPLGKFDEAAPEAFRRLAQLVSGPAPKKRDDQAKVAMDNCVSALFALARYKAHCCPAEVPAWQIVVAKLPIRDDEDEAKKVHKAVCELLLESHSGLLGPDHANLGKVLSALAEVYKQESLCTKETDATILRIFQQLPRDQLLKLAGGFSEKQQRKIENMLSAVVAQHAG